MELRISPPTSSKKSTWVTETTATMNRVIGTALVPAMITDGVNISVKPTTMVEAAAATSGTCRALRSGRNGMPSQSKTGV